MPKALIPIANRPMVWYSLDWCYRMGISTIHLITPPTSAPALEAALSQNPHLTSLPSPKPTILAPQSLSQDTVTASILRIPEIRTVITSDFLILPCDLLCEIPGESLLEAWMITQAGLGGATADSIDYNGPKMGLGGEKGGRRGGLGVWFETKTADSIKGEETDFLITAPLPAPSVPPPSGSLRPHISQLVHSTTTDTLHDTTDSRKTFPIRHRLLRTHPRIILHTTHRDAHIYLFPHWTLSLIARNPTLDSISEDVVGTWAKATWQPGLATKLSLPEIFRAPDDTDPETTSSHHSNALEEEIDLASTSTTHTSTLSTPPTPPPQPIPPFLSYLHPPHLPPITRIDTTALLLHHSLRLALLPPTPESQHPYSHPLKNASPTPHPPIQTQTTIQTPTTLLDTHVLVAPRAVIKESVIGANCDIKAGARLTRCLLMEGVVVGERVVLHGCVVGRRARVGSGCVLRECEVQEGFVVPEGVEGKGEKFVVFEGLEGSGGEKDGKGEGEVGDE
ncbi:hypothetical protein MMC12_003520 [Toensbergia leucococca]|nr:hypothetical protein [Toensbergia leucococca]